MTNEWRPIPSNPKYLVSSDGQVRHHDSMSPRKIQWDDRGYGRVNFWQDKKVRLRSVHVLVAEAFIGPRPEGMEVRHLDGNPSNNRADNLEYGTAVDNAADRERHGRTARGDRSGTSKVSDDVVAMIRVIYERKMLNQYQLATLFGISQAQINNIVLNKQRQKPAMVA